MPPATATAERPAAAARPADLASAMPQAGATTGRSLADLRGIGKLTAQQARTERGGNTVAAFFESNKSAMAAMLPKHMDADRMVKIALRALRTTPKLMECTLESLMGAVVTCSQLGLEPQTPLGHVYLIPFNGRRKINGRWQDFTDVQVVIGYKGMIELARRSGQIESISARVVYKNDDFDIAYGTEDTIVHKPHLGGPRGDMIGVYAVAKLKGGGIQFEFLTLSEIREIRDGSQGYQAAMRARSENRRGENPWIDDEPEMARKTAIRRLFKYLPMSIELASAVALDERGERAGTQGLDKVLDGIDYTEVVEAEPTTEAEAEDEEAQQEAAGAEAQEPQQQHQDEAAGPAQAAAADDDDDFPGTYTPREETGRSPQPRRGARSGSQLPLGGDD